MNWEKLDKVAERLMTVTYLLFCIVILLFFLAGGIAVLDMAVRWAFR